MSNYSMSVLLHTPKKSCMEPFGMIALLAMMVLTFALQNIEMKLGRATDLTLSELTIKNVHARRYHIKIYTR